MALTYKGNTEASTVANPPIVIAQSMSGSLPNATGLTGARLWFYSSTNTVSELNNSAAVSFSDGYELGMRSGDLVIGVTSTALSVTPLAYIAAVIGTTAGAYLSTSPEA